MKKKGLIVATIVMVLVLAVSLTTATYAWFQTSSVTLIEGFSVRVVSSNAVNIGVSKTSQHITKNLTTDAFWTGDVTSTPTAGVLGATFSGTTTGLSATLEHDINWGSQSKAVAAMLSSEDTNPLSKVTTDYAEIGDKANEKTGSQYMYVNAAVLNDAGTALADDITAAYANHNGGNAGDYVYLFLGAAPTKALSTNQLVIMVDASASQSTIVGILASLHVAYRITTNATGTEDVTTSEWEDVEIFEGIEFSRQLSGLTTNVTGTLAETYKATYGVVDVPAESYALIIDTGLSLTVGAIDQIELVIYIDGNDPDCINAAKGSSGSINIFFHTEEPTT